MQNFVGLVTGYTQLLTEAKEALLGVYVPRMWPPENPLAPNVLMAWAHPDDECLSGGPLGIRLRRDLGSHVCNLGVTLGREDQWPRRRKELEGACNYLGFELLVPDTNGFGKVYNWIRTQDVPQWTRWVDIVADILVARKPGVIITHHRDDWHPEHMGVHLLMIDALVALHSDFECLFVEAEYWQQMPSPNLMFEVSTADVVTTLEAVSFHQGELERNPYHLRYPALLSDTVRRCEVVTGRGTGAPDWNFAVMLRVMRWRRGQFEPCLKSPMTLGVSESIAKIFG